MNHPAILSRSPWVTGTFIGTYATAVALAPDANTRLLLSTPLLVVPLVWWILGGAERWLAAFFLAAWLLPPLPVAMGNSGPHVVLVFAALGAWIGLIRLNEWRLPWDSVSVPLLGLFACLCLSLGVALLYSGPVIAAASFARVLLFGISVFIYFYVRSLPAQLSAPFIRLLFCTAAISALFACIDFYYQFPAPAGFGPQFVYLDTGVFRRAQGLFYEASTLGNFCAFFLVMIASALLVKREQRVLPPWALLGGAIIFGGALILSYSRGSLVNLLVATSVLAWLHRSRLRWTRVLPALALSIVVGGLALFWFFPHFLWEYWTRIYASARFFFESPNGVLSGRVQSWAFLTDFLVEHPWHALVGVGYKTLPYSDFLGATTIADNTYLSMFVETGIAGLAALLALNAGILRASWRAARSLDAYRSFLGTWILCFWAGETVQMFSGDILTYWRVIPAYFLVLALASKS